MSTNDVTDDLAANAAIGAASIKDDVETAIQSSMSATVHGSASIGSDTGQIHGLTARLDDARKDLPAAKPLLFLCRWSAFVK